MRKTLTNIGNSLGLVIEKPILELLNITKETPLEMTTDGQRLILEPVRESRDERLRAASERVMREHGETFRKLAQ
jgi:antitoxin component of MazEF toxin-antitoxin module